MNKAFASWPFVVFILCITALSGAFVKMALADAVTPSVSYLPSTITNQDVAAALHPPDNVTITNNGGSPNYLFTQNGSFTYTFSGNELKSPTVFDNSYTTVLCAATLTNGNIVIVYSHLEGGGQGHVTFVIYDQSGNQVKSPTVIGDLGAVINVNVLENGSFYIVYVDANTSSGKFVIYDDSGNLVKTPTVFNTSGWGATTTLTNGNVLIVYPASNTAYGMFTIYDSAGDLVKSPTVFRSASTDNIHVTALANGNALIAYDSAFVIYDSDGNLVKSPVTLPQGQWVSLSPTTVANDNVMIAYHDQHNHFYGTFVIYDSSGNQVKSPTVFNSAETDFLSTTTLTNGNYVISYGSLYDSSFSGTFVIYDKNGNLIQPPTVYESGLKNISLTSVTSMPDGSFLIAYPGSGYSAFGTFVVYSGNSGSSTASVNWIDKIPPTATVGYSIPTLTNQDVIATLNPSKAVTVTNNGGSASYHFASNGSFTFQFQDAAGNTGSATATVSWIDKTPPTASISYSTTDLTGNNVVATVLPSEPITVTNNNGQSTYSFGQNGNFTFNFIDLAGNTGSVTATVNNIVSTYQGKAYSFVKRMYTRVLGRDADSSGLNYWYNRLIAGQTSKLVIIDAYIHTDEYYRHYVAGIYHEFMNRDADTGGLNYWTNRMLQGLSKTDLIANFAYSPEYLSQENAQFVSSLYEDFMNRTADPGGVTFWVGQLNSGAKTKQGMIRDFFYSYEFNAKYVQEQYQQILERGTDSGGEQYYVNQLQHGMDRMKLTSILLDCDEFWNK